MKVNTAAITTQGIKFSLVENNLEVARAYLYFMHNGLHQEPFGLLEDVFVAQSHRGEGLGTKLIEQVIQAAKQHGCYKLIATSRTSRPKVHQLYKRLSFQEQGIEFRIDF